MFGKLFLRILLMFAATAVASVVYGAEPQSRKQFTIILDPGHGGRDYGCSGRLTNEKTIVLDVAKRLGDIIEKEHPEIGLVYTRDTDRYLTLQQRADIANGADGDLFVSIHVNSVDRRSRNRTTVHGASVYTLGLHKSDNNLNVAMRENAVMELEQDYSAKYKGFDPNSSESYIMFELNQNSHVSNSLELASLMQNELISTAGRADKNVRQAGFWVLWAVAMPSVLVELDFICNPSVEKFLNSEKGRERCARALANAVSSYYVHHRNSGDSPVAAEIAPRQSAGGNKTEQPESEPTYHVQFLTSSRKLAAGDSRLAGVPDVSFYVDGRVYKYYSGEFSTLAKARKRAAVVRKKYPEAFIIKMLDGKRI